MRIIASIIISFIGGLGLLYYINHQINSWVIITAIYWALVSTGMHIYLNYITQKRGVAKLKISENLPLYTMVIAATIVVNVAGFYIFMIRQHCDIWSVVFGILSIALIVYIYTLKVKKSIQKID